MRRLFSQATAIVAIVAIVAIAAIGSYPRMHSKLFNTVVFMEEILKIRLFIQYVWQRLLKQVQDIELLDKDCREMQQKSG